MTTHTEVINLTDTSSKQFRVASGAGLGFSPDGNRLASAAAADNKVRIWDLATAKTVMTLKEHSGWVTTVAFSPDGQHVASGGIDKAVTVSNSLTGEQISSLTGHTSFVTFVTFSPDGKRIASCSHDNTVKIWNAIPVQDSLTMSAAPRMGLGFFGLSTVSPDSSTPILPEGTPFCSLPGNKVITWNKDKASDDKIRVTGELWSFVTTDNGKSVHVARSPNGRLFAIPSDREKSVKIIDSLTGVEKVTLNIQRHVVKTEFSPNSQMIAVCEKGKLGTYDVSIWDAVNGNRHYFTEGDRDSGCFTLRFSPDSKRIIFRTGFETIKLVEIASRKEVAIVANKKHAVDFSEDGNHLVLAGWMNEIKLLDTKGSEISTIKYPWPRSPGSKWRVSTTGRPAPAGRQYIEQIKIADATTSNEVLVIKGYNKNEVGYGDDFRPAFSPNNKLVAFTAGEGVQIWDLVSKQKIMSKKFSSSHGQLEFSPDSNRLACWNTEETDIHVLQVSPRAEHITLKGHITTVTSVSFSPNSTRLVSGSNDCAAIVWDLVTGQEIVSLPPKFFRLRVMAQGGTANVFFTPDGERVAGHFAALYDISDPPYRTGGEAIIRLWDGTAIDTSLGRKEGKTIQPGPPVSD